MTLSQLRRLKPNGDLRVLWLQRMAADAGPERGTADAVVAMSNLK